MQTFELGQHVILLCWKDGVPYVGSLKVLESEFKGETWATEGIIEHVYGLKFSKDVEFDKEMLEKELRYVKSELQDIRTMDKFTTRTEAECRVCYMKEANVVRADITGEFAVFLNIWQISARIKAKAVTSVEN